MVKMIRSYAKTSDRSRGWLRYLYRKANMPDDWDKNGQPNARWDNITGELRASWHRFDLVRSGLSIALMVQATPAWRKVGGYVKVSSIVGEHSFVIRCS